METELAFISEIEIEVRASGGGRFMRASFPYNVNATRASGGRVRKERFASGSLSWQVREFEKLQGEMANLVASTIDKARRQIRIEQLEDALEKRNTHLLIGHDFNRPIADMRTGNLTVEHTAEAVHLRATLPAEGEAPSWIEDAVKAVKGGQLRGVSPGFNVGPKGGERLVREVDGPSMVREILDAMAPEYSIVSRPAFPLTDVDVRADDLVTPPRRRYWL